MSDLTPQQEIEAAKVEVAQTHGAYLQARERMYRAQDRLNKAFARLDGERAQRPLTRNPLTDHPDA